MQCVQVSRSQSGTRSLMPWCFHGKADDSQRRQQILCFGDSLTAGFCSSGMVFHPSGEVLAQHADGLSVSVCGYSGRTAEEMLREQNSSSFTDCAGVGHAGKGLARVLQDGAPNLALILAGTNDLGQSLSCPGVTAEVIMERLKRLHAICHRNGVPTVAFTPPTVEYGPCRQMQRTLAGLLRDWARREPMVLDHFDIEELVPRGNASRFWDPDQIHMSIAGQTNLGSALARLLSLHLSSAASRQAIKSPTARSACQENQLSSADILSRPRSYSEFMPRSSARETLPPQVMMEQICQRAPLAVTRSRIHGSSLRVPGSLTMRSGGPVATRCSPKSTVNVVSVQVLFVR